MGTNSFFIESATTRVNFAGSTFHAPHAPCPFPSISCRKLVLCWEENDLFCGRQNAWVAAKAATRPWREAVLANRFRLLYATKNEFAGPIACMSQQKVK